ncbi:MAG: RNA-binding S4 domain-containing protein [Erysipelotrichia bacterium]|nr:RNA-binding S4 domain-containing protein [Erysipelotrichia bacterium]
MRLDKYLQVTGLIKRRALANEACKLGLIKVNQIVAKATREIAVGDIIDITLAKRETTIKVLQLIQGNSLKKTIRDEYFTILKDVERQQDNDE